MNLLICTGIYPPDIGGPATVMQRVREDLLASGHDVHVVTFGDTGSVEHITRVSRRGSFFTRTIRYIYALRAHLAKDAIVVATDVSSVGIPVRLALLGSECRLVFRLGGEWCYESATNNGAQLSLQEYWNRSPSIMERLKRELVSWVMQRAQRVIVVSDILVPIMQRLSPRAQIVVIPNIPIVARNTLSQDLHDPHVPLHLIFIGRFVPVKNLPFLARIFSGLHEAGRSVMCTWIGDGPDLSMVKTILSNVPGMTFLGAVSHTDALRHLQTSDCLVLPSFTDVSPNVVLEALALGIPSLVTHEHGLPKSIRGIIELDPRDPRAWSDAIMNLGNNEVYRALCRQIVIPSFSSSLSEEILCV